MSDTKPTPFVSDRTINIEAEREAARTYYLISNDYPDAAVREDLLRKGMGICRDLYESHLAEVMRERWVKVEDRLPDELQWVILRHNQPNTDAFDTGYIFTIDGRKTWKLRWEKHSLPLRFFTHWMPLPEPPNTPPSHG